MTRRVHLDVDRIVLDVPADVDPDAFSKSFARELARHVEVADLSDLRASDAPVLRTAVERSNRPASADALAGQAARAVVRALHSHAGGSRGRRGDGAVTQ